VNPVKENIATMINKLLIRPYRKEDEREVIELWIQSNLVVSTNNPKRDI